MTIQDLKYDAIVVGSGITGGWAAKELTEKGLRVLMLERGRHIEHRKDYKTEFKAPWQMPFRGKGDQHLFEKDYSIQRQTWGFDEFNYRWFVNDREHPYVMSKDKPFYWVRGYHLGGRSITWGRHVYRWGELDFEANQRDGHGIDWPIRYADIAPWYDHVEEFMGVSGQAEGLPQVPDGKFLPPMALNCAEEHLRSHIKDKFEDRIVTPGRVTNLSKPHNGRAACNFRSICERGCSFGAYFSSLSSTLPAAHATNLLTVRTDSIVDSLVYDEQQGRASGVRVIDANTHEKATFSAPIIFLCASALGSTQILLNSKSQRFPNGLGNSSGVLGRYLMDHAMGGYVSAQLPGFEDKYYHGNRPNGFYIPRFRNLGEQENSFVRGYGFQGGASRSGWGRGVDMPGFGKAFKEKLSKPGPWTIDMAAFGECLPRYENFVKLDEHKVDKWGIPLLQTSFSYGDNEYRMIEDATNQGIAMLKAAGATNIEASSEIAPGGLAIHEMGTARMGRDPKTSVLNANNQCHDVPNVFVTDGACMTSSACQNPSITYMALTARAANFAADALRRGDI